MLARNALKGNKTNEEQARKPADAAVQLVRTIDLVKQAVELFKQKMKRNQELSYVLDGERVASLQSLLILISSVKAYQELLRLACLWNDAEAIHVLLRADKSPKEFFTISLIAKLFAKPFYSPLQDEKPDRTALSIIFKFRSRLKEIFYTINVSSLLHDKSLPIEQWQDEYLMMMVLSAVERFGKITEVSSRRQKLLNHACRFNFKEWIIFCCNFHIFPDIGNVALTEAAHSPLAHVALSPRVDKREVQDRLIQCWPAESASLNPICALELLAASHLLEGVDDIRAELRAYLARQDQDVAAIVNQVVVSDFILILVDKEPKLLQSLIAADYHNIIAKTQSSVLFNWVSEHFDQEFDHAACLTATIEEFQRLFIMNDFRQEHILQRFSSFFEDILPSVANGVTTPVLEFILAVFIQRNCVRGFSRAVEKFPTLAGCFLKNPFSTKIKLNGIDFTGHSPLSIALRVGAGQVAIWIYRYSTEHQWPISESDRASLGLDLLTVLLSEEKRDIRLIARCFCDFSIKGCDYVLVKKLLKLCFSDRDSPDLGLLRSVVRLAAPYFQDVFFNLYSHDNPDEQPFSVDQLENLALAFGENNNELRVQHALTTAHDKAHKNMLRSLRLQQLKEQPLEGLTPDARDKVMQTPLFDLCFQWDNEQKAQQKDNIHDLMIRRLFFLLQTNPAELAQESMACRLYPKKFNDVGLKDIRSMAFTFLCDHKQYEIAELILVLCRDLNFSEMEPVDNYLAPLRVLCDRGNAALVKMFMSYLVKDVHRPYFTPVAIHVPPFETRLSPMYYAAAYNIIVPSQHAITQIRDSDALFKKVDEAALLQNVYYVYSVSCDEKVFTALNQAVDFKVIIKKLLKYIKTPLLNVAMMQQDSSLILMAILCQYQGHFPQAKREEVLPILFLSPHVDLAVALRINADDIARFDGFTFCLTQLEKSLMHYPARLLAQAYCELICYILRDTEYAVSLRQVQKFIQLLYQFSQLLKADTAIQQPVQLFCRQAVASGKVSPSILLGITWDERVFRFIEQSFKEGSKDSKVLAVKNYIALYRSRLDYHRIDTALQNPENLTVLELCRLLVASGNLPEFTERLEVLLRKRIPEHPDEVNEIREDETSEAREKICPVLVLARSTRKDWFDYLLGQPSCRFSDITVIRSVLQSICDFNWPDETLTKFWQTLPADVRVEQLAIVGSSTGRSPLFFLYNQKPDQTLVNFFIENGMGADQYSARCIFELFILIMRWISDRDLGQYFLRLKFFETAFLQIFKLKQWSYVNVMRRYSFSNSDLLNVFRTSEEFSFEVEGHNLDFLVNAATCLLQESLFSKIFHYLDSYDFKFDLTRSYVWLDGRSPSTLLTRLRDAIGAERYIKPGVKILKEILNRIDVLTDGIQAEIIEILKNQQLSQDDVGGVLAAAELSAENIKKIFRFACQERCKIVLAIIHHYGQSQPDDDISILLYEGDNILEILIKQVSLLGDRVLTAFLKVLTEKLQLQSLYVIQMLNQLDQVSLDFLMHKAGEKGWLRQALDALGLCRASQGVSFEDYLRGILNDKLIKMDAAIAVLSGDCDRCSTDVSSLALCSEIMLEITRISSSLRSLRKKMKEGFERKVKDDPYRDQSERVSALEKLIHDKKSIVATKQVELLAEQEKQQTLERRAHDEEAERIRKIEEEKAAQLRLQQEREACAKEIEQARQVALAAEISRLFLEPLARLQEEAGRFNVKDAMTVIALNTLKVDVDSCLKKTNNILAGMENRSKVGDAALLAVGLHDAKSLRNSLCQLMPSIDTQTEVVKALDEQRRIVAEKELQLAKQKESRLVEEKLAAEREATKRAEEEKLKQEKAEKLEELLQSVAGGVFQAVVAEELTSIAEEELKFIAEERFFKAYENNLTERLREQAQRVSQNSQGFYQKPGASVAVPIVAVVPRAKLIADARGFKIEFTGEKEMRVAVGCDLYLLNPPKGINEGCCCAYFSFENHAPKWILLQNETVFSPVNIQPLYPGFLVLQHGEKNILSAFVGGLQKQPAANLGLKS